MMYKKSLNKRGEKMNKTNKVSIIGAGFVGSATTLAIAESGMASNIVLVDLNKEKAWRSFEYFSWSSFYENCRCKIWRL